jgi:hypothetical protein
MKMERLRQLIELLGMTEEQAIRALLSAFASIQPGSMRQGFVRHASYGVAPETRVIWDVLVAHNFRCAVCQTHYDLTLDHIDSNPQNIALTNLRIVCRDHNRAANSRGLQNQNANLRIYNAIIDLWKRTGRFPTDPEIQRESGVSQIGGSRYMIKFFRWKVTGDLLPLRTYTRRSV